MGSPVIFKGSLAKVLPSRGIELRDGTLILSGDLDPNVISVDAPEGSLYLSSLTLKSYVKADNGNTTNWVAPGAGSQGPQGPQGESWQETFETVSKNLKAKPFALNYTDGRLTSIVYNTAPAEFITKTLDYNEDGTLNTITLSGDTPSGIELIKTLEYTGGVLTAVSYSGSGFLAFVAEAPKSLASKFFGLFRRSA